MQKSEYLTIRQAAELLQLSPRTVRRRCRDRWEGFPPLIKFGPRLGRIEKVALEEWQERQRQQQEWR